jgi:regulatory protein
MTKKNVTYSPQQALVRLQNLCSRSEKCIYDIKLKLQKWEIEPAESEKIIASLQKNGFVNEDRYAEAYVKEKLNMAKWGRQKIIQSLKAKQVPLSLISKTLSNTDGDKYKVNLLELLKKKNMSIKSESECNRKAKLLRFALSRGYEYELVMELLSLNIF